MKLATVRNALIANRPIQRCIRVGARSGMLPPGVYSKLPPFGLHPLTSPAGHGILYWADFSDQLARNIIWENLKVWEASSLKLFSGLAQNAERVLDVGAYSGIYSLIACADSQAEVIAVEPNPAILPVLQRNIEINGWQDRVKIIPQAVSDKPGSARLSIPADATAAYLDSASRVGPEVQITTIDAILDGSRADAIKLDVEGHEVRAIEGARNTLAQYHPALIVECLSANAFNAVKQAVSAFSYTVCYHLAPNGPVPVSAHAKMPRYSNYLFQSNNLG